MSYKRFTREELSKVKNISITDYMRNKGYELKPLSKNEFKIAGYGGLILSEAENVWYCFAASRGGGLIQLVMFLENTSWKEAVQDILNSSDEQTVKYDRSKSEKDNLPLIRPERNPNAKNVIAYLCSTRMIDYDLVIQCFKKKLLYQDKRRNCVFVGYDKEGHIGHIHLKGTNPNRSFAKDISGSDKCYGFSIHGQTNTVFAFESPIDLLSYMSLQKRLDLELNDSYISLYGTSNQRLMQYLIDYPDTKEIVLCLDNDEVGEKATQEITSTLNDQYKDQYQIRIDKPQLKDFNDTLIYSLRGESKLNQHAEM